MVDEEDSAALQTVIHTLTTGSSGRSKLIWTKTNGI